MYAKIIVLFGILVATAAFNSCGRHHFSRPPRFNQRGQAPVSRAPTAQCLQLLASFPLEVSSIPFPDPSGPSSLESLVWHSAARENSFPNIWHIPDTRDKEASIRFLTKHVVSQGLDYRERLTGNPNVATIDSFRQRSNANKLDNSGEKTNNHLTVLPGVSGSGKSSLLVHLPYSTEYANFCAELAANEEEKFPFVSLFTFNKKMVGTGEIALGLRVIYGVLKSLAYDISWNEFYQRWKGDKLASQPCLEAVRLLRKYFVGHRRFFIGVDEISKAAVNTHVNSKEAAEKQSGILTELGQVLDDDPLTDIVVTSLSTTYIKGLVTKRSQRRLDYIPFAPLLKGELNEQLEEPCRNFANDCEDYISKEEKTKGTKSSEATIGFRKRILENVHLLASGHPRSIQFMVEGIKTMALQNTIYSELFKYRSKPWKIIRMLAQYISYIEPPATSSQCDLILSTTNVATQSEEFRVMLENAQCFTVSEQSTFFQQDNFRVGTTVAAFLSMIYNICRNPSDYSTSPMCNAAMTLFSPKNLDNMEISDVWERCHAMSTIARNAEEVLMGDNHFFRDDFDAYCVLEMTARAPLELILTEGPLEMKYRPNTLFSAPPKNPGFELLTCLVGKGKSEIFVYQAVKAFKPKEVLEEWVNGFVKTVARKLGTTLLQHAKVQLGLTVERLDAVSSADLGNVFFLFSMFGVELGEFGLDSHKLQRQVGEVLQQWINTSDKFHARKHRLAKLFVDRHWTNFAFQGSEKVKKTMQPTLWPFADLVQQVSTLGDDDVENEDIEEEYI